MKKTIWAVLVFAFLAIPLLIITVTAFGGGSAITFPIESFSLKWFANVFALKSFRRSFITSLEVDVYKRQVQKQLPVPESQDGWTWHCFWCEGVPLAP